MLQVIENLPPHVTGIHAYGEVTEQAYTGLLTTLIDQQVKKTGRINFLLVLETDIKNFASGMWCGNVRMGLKHFFRWKKIAILSDQRALTGYSDLFKYIIPGKFKNFHLQKMDEAIIWVSGK
jgi:hypothetical protein